MNKNKPDTLSIIDLAQMIKQRPGMYFGNKITLTSLHHLLFGFGLNATIKSTPPFEYFPQWISKRLGVPDNAQHWTDIILNKNNNDELSAFWNFYELLDEFILIRPLNIHETNLPIASFSFYFSTDKGRPGRYIDNDFKKSIIEPAPYHIKLIEFNFWTFAYFYDFDYVLGDKKAGKLWHYFDFDNIDKWKQQLDERFGHLEWSKIGKDKMNDEFEQIIKNS